MISLTISDVLHSALHPEWLKKLLSDARKLKLNTTSWQAGAPERTILAVVSRALELTDNRVTDLGHAGFLRFGSKVTPEFGPGFLDLLADSLYDVQRIQAGYAGGALAVTNTSASTYGPFLVGGYHVTNPHNEQGYSTTEALTVPPSPEVGDVEAVTNDAGLIRIKITSHGLTTGDVVSVLDVTGVDELEGKKNAYYVTVVDADRFTLDGSVFAGAWTGGGTVYEPTLTTVRADVIGTVGSSENIDGVPDVHTVTQAVTSLVGVSVDNPEAYFGSDTERNEALVERCLLKLQALSMNGPKGAYEFFALSASQYAAKLTPPLVLGTPITRVRPVQEPASGTMYVFAANHQGTPSDSDVDTVESVIHAFATPQAVTAFAEGATNRNVSVEVTVWLPGAHNNQTTRVLFQQAVQAYFRALRVGGVSDPNGTYDNIVPIEAVLGTIFDVAEDSGIEVQNISGLLNGAAANVQLVVNPSLLVAEVAKLVPAVPTIKMVSV